jgi:hypothetical protein
MRWRSVRAQRSVDRGRVGGAIEPRNLIEVRGADVLPIGERQHRRRRFRESLVDPARSEIPGITMSPPVPSWPTGSVTAASSSSRTARSASVVCEECGSGARPHRPADPRHGHLEFQRHRLPCAGRAGSRLRRTCRVHQQRYPSQPRAPAARPARGRRPGRRDHRLARVRTRRATVRRRRGRGTRRADHLTRSYTGSARPHREALRASLRRHAAGGPGHHLRRVRRRGHRAAARRESRARTEHAPLSFAPSGKRAYATACSGRWHWPRTASR